MDRKTRQRGLPGHPLALSRGHLENRAPQSSDDRDTEITCGPKKAKAPTRWGSVVWISLPAPGGTTCVGITLLPMSGRTSYCAADIFAHSGVLTQHIEHLATHDDATAVRSVL